MSGISWIGKLTGAALGYLVTHNIFGVALGALLGHQFDRGFQRVGRGPAGVRGFFGHRAAERQQVFFESTFLVMGHLAKADGRVSEEEIQLARSVMHQMQLRPEQVQLAIDQFTRGKDGAFRLDEQLDLLRDACRGQPELVRTFLEIQFELALAKGGIRPEERQLLWRIAGRLGVGRAEFAQFEAILRARRSFGGGQAQEQRGDGLEAAYKALGLDPGATDREVKTAYRRLMNRHHPDKLIAKGLPDSMLEIAKERTREIRAAYELIRDRRGMR